MSELYNRIELLCKEKGVTITSMCKAAEVSRGSLTDLKAGRSKKLSAESLAKIAEFLGVSVDYLLGNDTKSSEVEYLDDETKELLDTLRKRPEMRTLFKVSRDASKEDVEMAVGIIEKFKKGSGSID